MVNFKKYTDRNFFFTLLIFSSLHFTVAFAKPLKIDVSAQSAILINAETGAILYEKNAHTHLPPASITKIATALYVLEKKQNFLNELAAAAAPEIVGVASAMLKRTNKTLHPSYRLEPDGTNMAIRVGEKLSLQTLIYGLMLASANDAANVLAHHISGSIPQFLEDLNVYFKEKGFHETHFTNPHGLHDSGHYTTAYDLARITQEAMKNPFFREVVSTVHYPREATNKQPSSILVQHNRLLKRGPFFYPKAIGVKTGYHSDAGHTFVAAAKDENRTLIAVLLNCPDNNSKYKDAIALFEAAFTEAKMARTLFSKQHDTFTRAIRGAKDLVVAGLKEDVSIFYYLSEEPEIKAFLHWQAVEMPLVKNQHLGEVHIVTSQGEILKKAPLFAVNDAEKTLAFKMIEGWHRLKHVVFRKESILVFLMLFVTVWAMIVYRKKEEEITS